MLSMKTAEYVTQLGLFNGGIFKVWENVWWDGQVGVYR
jgi:hypothetical protein